MKVRLLFILMVSCMCLVACQSKNEDDALPTKNDGNHTTQVKNSSPDTKQDLSNSEVASHLASIATDIPNVHDSAAVIAGPYAVVGIDVDKDIDSSKVGTIKYSVTEALEHDPYGKTAVVIADGDITQRLRNMGTQIKEGHPVQGVVDELSEIVGRYMPEAPVRENQPSEPDENKKVIPEEEQEDLDNIRKNQTNPDD